MVDFIWNNQFLINNDYHPSIDIPNRKKSLKEDTRTWSASVKQELLYQRKLINEDVLNRLSKARKIRNKLVHQGVNVDKQTAKDILEVTIDLIKVIVPKSDLQSRSFINNNFREMKENDFHPNFQSWKNLPDSNFVESVFGKNITKKIKK